MKAKKILTSIAVLILASLACMTSTAIVEPTATPMVWPTPTFSASLEENPAGAVFEVPQWWMYPQLAPLETAMPAAEKGRSNYR